MEWQIVKVGERSGKSVPFVSIGRGQLVFNAVACKLVNDKGNYKFAQILKGKEKNGKAVIAVKFLEEYEEDSIPIKRKQQNGKVIQGMSVVNKGVIEEVFGKDGSNDGTVRRKVELIPEADNILKILD